jgi:hypothetical protein
MFYTCENRSGKFSQAPYKSDTTGSPNQRRGGIKRLLLFNQSCHELLGVNWQLNQKPT